MAAGQVAGTHQKFIYYFATGKAEMLFEKLYPLPF
jgi:hypothetical protein